MSSGGFLVGWRSPAEQGASEADETAVEVEATYPAHGQPADLTQQREARLDDVAQCAPTVNAHRIRLEDDRRGAALAAGLGGRRCGIPCPPAEWRTGAGS